MLKYQFSLLFRWLHETKMGFSRINYSVCHSKVSQFQAFLGYMSFPIFLAWKIPKCQSLYGLNPHETFIFRSHTSPSPLASNPKPPFPVNWIICVVIYCVKSWNKLTQYFHYTKYPLNPNCHIEGQIVPVSPEISTYFASGVYRKGFSMGVNGMKTTILMVSYHFAPTPMHATYPREDTKSDVWGSRCF